MTVCSARAFGDASLIGEQADEVPALSIYPYLCYAEFGGHKRHLKWMNYENNFFTLLSLLLFSAVAQAATDYGFSVGEITVTSDNCNNIVSNYITGGTVYYVASSKTLYMNNVIINVTGTNNRVIFFTGVSTH